MRWSVGALLVLVGLMLVLSRGGHRPPGPSARFFVSDLSKLQLRSESILAQPGWWTEDRNWYVWKTGQAFEIQPNGQVGIYRRFGESAEWHSPDRFSIQSQVFSTRFFVRYDSRQHLWLLPQEKTGQKGK